MSAIGYANTLPVFASGDLLGVGASSAECTISQAAKVLDMPEACVIGLLNDEVIVSRQENGECRIQWDSLMEFEADYRKGLEVLSEITREWQEMGLYDD